MLQTPSGDARLLSHAHVTAAPTRGWLFLHACRKAFVPHLESELARLFGTRTSIEWATQTLRPSSCRADIEWRGAAGTAARLMSSLRTFPGLHAEVTEEATADTPAMRFALVPDLGLWSGVMGAAGEVLLSEHQILAAMALPEAQMRMHLNQAMGQPWDALLEPMRAEAQRIPTTLLRVI